MQNMNIFSLKHMYSVRPVVCFLHQGSMFGGSKLALYYPEIILQE